VFNYSEASDVTFRAVKNEAEQCKAEHENGKINKRFHKKNFWRELIHLIFLHYLTTL